MMLEDYKKAKKIYFVLRRSGEFYNWHSSKQIAMIKVEEKKINEAIQVMEKSFKKLKKPSFYQIYDFAYFLKNNKEFEKSIKYYSILIDKISQLLKESKVKNLQHIQLFLRLGRLVLN